MPLTLLLPLLLASLAHTEEVHEFRAETSRLLDIIIHSLYSDRDIFVRELISNSVDALEKLRYLSLMDNKILGDAGTPLEIRVSTDKENRLIIFEDTGIGMNREELLRNLGTIAESGTRRFRMSKDAASDSASSSTGAGDAAGDAKEGSAAGIETASGLIGMFGVGFFSSYLVSSRVDFYTRRALDAADGYAPAKVLKWSSDATSSFSVEEASDEDLGHRGSKVVLHLRDDADEFLDTAFLKRLVVRYSNFVGFPVYVELVEEKPEDIPEDELEEEMTFPGADEEHHYEPDADAGADADGAEGDSSAEGSAGDDADTNGASGRGAPRHRMPRMPHHRMVETRRWADITSETQSLWLRTPAEITDDEYVDFYAKALHSARGESSMGSDDAESLKRPITWVHFRGEGEADFRTLIYVPNQPAANYYEAGPATDDRDGVRLYISRVFVTNETGAMIPRWLQFVRGIVDSDSIRINLSREFIQESKLLKKIGERIAKAVLRKAKELATDAQETVDAYEQFARDYVAEYKALYGSADALERDARGNYVLDDEQALKNTLDKHGIAYSTDVSVSDREAEAAADDDTAGGGRTKAPAAKTEAEKVLEKLNGYVPAIDYRFCNFYGFYKRSLLLGAFEDSKNKDALLGLLRFPSTTNLRSRPDLVRKIRDSRLVNEHYRFFSTLQEYVDRMPAHQKDVYFVSCENFNDCTASPYVDAAREQDVEVMFLLDAAQDMLLTAQIKDFKDANGTTRGLKNLARADTRLPTKPKTEDERDEEERASKTLDARVRKYKVKLFKAYMKKSVALIRAVDESAKMASNTPAIIAAGAGGATPLQERLIRQMSQTNNMEYQKAQRTLEVNFNHPLVRKLVERVYKDNPYNPQEEDSDEPLSMPDELRVTEALKTSARMLYDIATYLAGYDVADRRVFTSALFKSLETSVGDAPEQRLLDDES